MNAVTRIQNRTFDEIQIGDSAQLIRKLTDDDIKTFAVMSGDVNPAHVDPEFAGNSMFHKIIAHGMWGGALISTVLGTELPGPGTIYLDQSLHFLRPVAIGDTVTVILKVIEKIEKNHHLVLDCVVTNQHDEIVISGQAGVLAPTEKIARERILLPELELLKKGRYYRQLLTAVTGMEPLRTAVVHPVDRNSLDGALQAWRANLIVPVLVGPEKKIRLAAEEAGIDLTGFDIVPALHSDDAAAKAVTMARSGKVESLMKGALHTDELLHAVVDRDTGLRGKRRLSHVFAIDAPRYPRPLFITDAAINIYPSLEEKVDIVQNAIDLVHALGIDKPKVALLSAVETVAPAIRSTLDAAALCKMAERGQITGAILDGPLAFDNAVSAEAARIKGIESPVAGCADIFVVPDLEAGNMLAKQLEYLAEAEVAGIALGAKVPIILTSRADKTPSRLASCAIALLLARQKSAKS